MGETTTGLLLFALRRAASWRSAWIKNGLRAWLQQPACWIAPGFAVGRIELAIA
jgi:hypothetical protein